MERKNTFAITVTLTVLYGSMALLFLGVVYNILSPREFGIGLLALVVGFPILMWYFAKRRAKKYRLSYADSSPAIDDKARRRITRRILRNKI